MQLRITSRKKLTSLLCALGLISIVAIYPRQTVNFFYSTAVQITDYIHFYGYRPVKSFAIRIPASYTIHGIDVSRWQERDRLAAGGKNARQWYPLTVCFY